VVIVVADPDVVVVVENDRGGRCRGAGGAASPRPTRPRAATRGWRWRRKAAGGPSAATTSGSKSRRSGGGGGRRGGTAVRRRRSRRDACYEGHYVHELCLVECVMRWEVALSN